ncbi:restriction endonuclease [Micrococcus luteus]|uniref:restriction endonuclease n=1 Tax=Micrococcus luteus TaxID=1270 RepID=UPI0011A4DB97|nr:DEAD/DEAH box helicase family protein [Micrococcus luteus]MBY0170747.1 DEAD/DEAH box helicase family protein [Micrococcus luteus]MBY0173137.1 DEAD/DEAH box helicase family protein [Micrococcus luteus]MBY0179895.1 DEAD/DEAH box helicase family protein [Micrococcus luteus]MCV7449137.1 DEAD/DEAH box helicase family protein [Micrococcus luteus]MCV7554129.1 DEAD/DEAH box helicase family protein [Micrococcus luteus]
MGDNTASSGFKFDASQAYQLDAIKSVVDLFDGQPKDAEKLETTLRGQVAAVNETENAALDLELSQEVGAVGNRLVLDRDTVLANLQRVQDKNGLEVASKLFDDSGLDFDIEMETGTGKTYVYLRTIFELAERYNFTKFIILVPSVAIREGVNTSIRLMRSHFENLYKKRNITFDSSVYSGKTAEEVQSFATSTNVQIMVMTIDSIRGNANTRIIHQTRDKLNGLKPIDYLKATHPVVIMDEPQNMESLLSQSAVSELDPLFTLRYSATHKKLRNVVYRLDPVDAHDLGLVKQIVVADVQQQGADATPYIKLVEVKNDKGWVARLELSCRKADGTLKRKVVSVKPNKELSSPRVTGNPAYDGWRLMSEMNLAYDGAPGSVELNLHGTLHEGESIGGSSGAIYKEMIRETIKEHLRKETQLRAKGIKVLSLFFIDKVESFLGNGSNNNDANGQFVQWFDELFREERAKSPQWQELLPQDPAELRRGYFSVLKGKKGAADKFQDTSGTTKADDDAYELIMQQKERLLDENEPTRFVFSHSALREGWDNPNVFQICTLREMGAETERRQTLGRGLRLPVAKSEGGYERVADRGIATLTVVANESYKQFADALQKEYKDAGVEIGRVRKAEFSKIPLPNPDGSLTDENLGYEGSVSIWEHLLAQKFIDKDGVVQPKFQPNTLDFSLNLPVDFSWAEPFVVELVGRANIGTYIKPKSKRHSRKLNKELFANPEFERFWETISRRTTYRVEVERDKIIDNSVKAIKEAPDIDPLRIQVTRAGVKVLRGGAKGQELGSRQQELRGSYDLPDIIGELQEATSLTRKTIVDILVGSGRLDEFIANPNDFIAMARRLMQTELAKLVVDGVQYEKIAGSVYELRELRKDGEDEKERFLDQMYKLENADKSNFDYVVYDSDPERQFAELLDGREDIKFFMKLPDKFKIDTPVGPYNPDWAIVKHEDGEERVYMIRETKSTDDEIKRRPTENAKIKSAEKHFEAIGVPNYAVSVPGSWRL